MPTQIPLRAKHTRRGASGGSKGGAYRGRTGPRCCGPGCPSTRKKSGKFVDRKGEGFSMRLK